MKKVLVIVLFTLFSFKSKGQDSLYFNYSVQKESSISLGYSYSFADPNDKNFHLIESRYQVQTYGGQHATFATISAGLDLGLNTDDLLIGPKVGAIFGYGGFFFGTDVVYYTDFSAGTLRLVPSFGFGFHQVRLSINPHIRLLNRGFEPVDRGHVNLTVKLFKVK